VTGPDEDAPEPPPESWTSTILILGLLAAAFAVAFMCTGPL